MNTTESNPAGIDPQEEADREAVYRHAFEGQPLSSEVRSRVRERAARIKEEMYRTHGYIDAETFQKLLSDDDES